MPPVVPKHYLRERCAGRRGHDELHAAQRDFSFSVLEDLVVAQSGARQVLYVYWVGLFYCPWFRTFGEAVAANPLPLPFNGTWPLQDCVGAP